MQENQQLKGYIKSIKKGTKSTYSHKNKKNFQDKNTTFKFNHQQKNVKKYINKN